DESEAGDVRVPRPGRGLERLRPARAAAVSEVGTQRSASETDHRRGLSPNSGRDGFTPAKALGLMRVPAARVPPMTAATKEPGDPPVTDPRVTKLSSHGAGGCKGHCASQSPMMKRRRATS